jgi:aminoglycoside phosphotransferase (APT) family kinase protein
MNTVLDVEPLKSYLSDKLSLSSNQIDISKISGGYSNLTFLIETPSTKLILRRPPFGEKIAKAHDMGREFKILQSLHNAGYSKSPRPILFCEDELVFGSPFFLMEYVEGFVLRNKLPEGKEFSPRDFEQLSQNSLDCLIELHSLELENSGLIQLGKPQGYAQRQVEGWTERYFKAKTHELYELEQTAAWLKNNLPLNEPVSFIHNDFKYDNLVLDQVRQTEIRAVLDWEMATVGNPLMDLGTSLAYWAEEDDPQILKLFNLSHLAGNFTRKQAIDYYSKKTGLPMDQMIFYYSFGLFKVAVIAQQIFKRYSMGFANDPRFAGLIHVVEAAGKKAQHSINTQKI